MRAATSRRDAIRPSSRATSTRPTRHHDAARKPVAAPRRGTETSMAKNRMIPRTIIKQTLAASAVYVTLCAPALAEGEMPDSEHGRYTFNKVADGFLRLDTQTGQVSVCSQRTVGFACQTVPDDRTVLENEIARLRTE